MVSRPQQLLRLSLCVQHMVGAFIVGTHQRSPRGLLPRTGPVHALPFVLPEDQDESSGLAVLDCVEPSQYASKSYWQEYYESQPQKAAFEWHGEYFDFSGAISDALPERGQRAACGGAADAFHALALGCGNSKLSSQLLENEKRVALVTSVDYSPRVIDDMRARHADHPQAASLRWEATDVRDMRALFADESIDVIVDKACVDALSCSDGFDSQKLGLPAVAAECARILAPGGGWLVVSFNQPSIMLPLLERPEWDVAHRSQRGNVHLYTARKH